MLKYLDIELDVGSDSLGNLMPKRLRSTSARRVVAAVITKPYGLPSKFMFPIRALMGNTRQVARGRVAHCWTTTHRLTFWRCLAQSEMAVKSGAASAMIVKPTVNQISVLIVMSAVTTSRPASVSLLRRRAFRQRTFEGPCCIIFA